MLNLKIELGERGWLTICCTGDGDAVELEASYLTDTPLELVQAANLIFQGQPEARFSMQQEPGENRGIIRRSGDTLTLHILRCDETFSRAADDAGEEVLRIPTQPRAWGNTVWRAMNALRQGLGPGQL